LRILPSFGTFETGQTLLYTNSDATGGEISQIIGSPEMRYRSGEVMHLQNIRPVDRSPEQKEEIKLIVEF
jgi:hypothetical protein